MRGDSPMPLHVGDFLASTEGWPMAIRGGYLTLLAHQWSMGSVPEDPREVAKLLNFEGEISGKFWGKFWGMVSKKFTSLGNGRMVNLRLEEHRLSVERTRESRRRGGRISANKMWGKVDSSANSSATPRADSSAMTPDLREEKSKSSNSLSLRTPTVTTPDKKTVLSRQVPPIPVSERSGTLSDKIRKLAEEKKFR